mgnify:CR=1 FL=1
MDASDAAGLDPLDLQHVAVGVGVLATWRPLALVGLAALPLAVAPARTVLGGATGAALIPVLGATGRVQLVAGLLTAIGLGIGA